MVWTRCQIFKNIYYGVLLSLKKRAIIQPIRETDSVSHEFTSIDLSLIYLVKSLSY